MEHDVFCLYRQILKCHTVMQVLSPGWPYHWLAKLHPEGRLCGSSSFTTLKPWFLPSDFPWVQDVICAMPGFFSSWLLSSRSLYLTLRYLPKHRGRWQIFVLFTLNPQHLVRKLVNVRDPLFPLLFSSGLRLVTCFKFFLLCLPQVQSIQLETEKYQTHQRYWLLPVSFPASFRWSPVPTFANPGVSHLQHRQYYIQ